MSVSDITEQDLMETARQCITLAECKQFAITCLGLDEVDCDSARFGAEGFTEWKFKIMRKWRNENPDKKLQNLRDLIRDFYQSRRPTLVRSPSCDAASAPASAAPASAAPDHDTGQVDCPAIVDNDDGEHPEVAAPEENQPSEDNSDTSHVNVPGVNALASTDASLQTPPGPFYDPSYIASVPAQSSVEMPPLPMNRGWSCPDADADMVANLPAPPPAGPFYSRSVSVDSSLASSCTSSVDGAPRVALNRTYNWHDGSEYTGDLLHGQRHGYGLYTNTNGDCYEGVFNQDQYHGWGKLVYKNGVIYDGEWFDGKKHGNGTYIFQDGKTKYVGEFWHDYFHGRGEMTYENSTKYKGDWVMGKQHGEGVITYANEQRQSVTYRHGTLVV